jgi:hypothetical protein
VNRHSTNLGIGIWHPSVPAIQQPHATTMIEPDAVAVQPSEVLRVAQVRQREDAPPRSWFVLAVDRVNVVVVLALVS